jgi:hypothetical protein
LQGLGPNCMFGSLLMSSAGSYKTIPVPGQLLRLETAAQLRVAVYRAHVNRQDCGGAWYCNYVYELRDGWFRLIGVCPETGCESVLSGRGPDQEQRAARATDTSQ